MENNILAAPQGYYVFSSYNLVVTSDVMILFAHISSAVDIISAIEFDKSGDHLATGDRGGRVVLFERTDTKDVSSFFSCKICFEKMLCAVTHSCKMLLSAWRVQEGS
jgi:hypothetical protein